MTQKIPTPRHGLLHVLDAARYSYAGLRRLLQESAARLELAGAVLGLLLLALLQASLPQYFVFLGLCAFVLLIEALNTAMEVIVDHLSPEWSRMAKDAKDLGSLAVALALALPAGYLLMISAQAVLG